MPAQTGQRLRQRMGNVLAWSRAHRSLPELPCRTAILCFHNLTAQSRDVEVEEEVMELGQFRRLLDLLHRSFRVISLAELLDCLRARRSAPARSVVITFDDGYASNYHLAAAELASRGLPWSEFLPAMLIETQGRQWTDDLAMLIHRGSRRRVRVRWEGCDTDFDLHSPAQRREAVRFIRESCRYLPEAQRQERLRQIYDGYSIDELQCLRARYSGFAPMTWDQARELQAAGVDVGSHGLNHVALAPQALDEIRHEIVAARQLLRRELGEHSPHFSYPYGRRASISAETRGVLTELGYHCALTLDQRIIEGVEHELMELPRLIVPPSAGRMSFTLS